MGDFFSYDVIMMMGRGTARSFLQEGRILRLENKPQRRFQLGLFSLRWSFRVQLLMHLLLLFFLPYRRDGFSLDQGILFLIEYLFLDVLMGREWQILLSDLLTQHSPLLLTLKKDSMLLPRPITGQTGKIAEELPTGTFLAS